MAITDGLGRIQDGNFTADQMRSLLMGDVKPVKNSKEIDTERTKHEQEERKKDTQAKKLLGAIEKLNKDVSEQIKELNKLVEKTAEFQKKMEQRKPKKEKPKADTDKALMKAIAKMGQHKDSRNVDRMAQDMSKLAKRGLQKGSIYVHDDGTHKLLEKLIATVEKCCMGGVGARVKTPKAKKEDPKEITKASSKEAAKIVKATFMDYMRFYGRVLKPIGKGIGESFGVLFSKIGNGIYSKFNNFVSEGFKKAGNLVPDWANRLFTNIRNGFNKGVERVENWLNWAGEKIAIPFKAIGRSAASLWDKTTETFSKGSTNLKNWFGRLKKSIVGSGPDETQFKKPGWFSKVLGEIFAPFRKGLSKAKEEYEKGMGAKTNVDDQLKKAEEKKDEWSAIRDSAAKKKKKKGEGVGSVASCKCICACIQQQTMHLIAAMKEHGSGGGGGEGGGGGNKGGKGGGLMDWFRGFGRGRQQNNSYNPIENFFRQDRIFTRIQAAGRTMSSDDPVRQIVQGQGIGKAANYLISGLIPFVGPAFGQLAENLYALISEPLGKQLDYFKESRQTAFETAGITRGVGGNNLNDTIGGIERQKEALKAYQVGSEEVLKTNQNFTTVQMTQLRLWRRGIRDAGTLNKVMTSGLNTARMLGANAEETANLFADMSQNFQMSTLEIAQMGRGMRDIARETGITGDKLVGIVRSSETFMKNLLKSGNLTSTASRNITGLLSEATLTGTTEGMQKFLETLSSNVLMSGGDEKMKNLSYAASGGNSNLLQQLQTGQLLQNRGGIREFGKGLQDVLNMFTGGRKVEELDGYKRAAADAALKDAFGLGINELQMLIKNFENASKSFSQKYKELEKLPDFQRRERQEAMEYSQTMEYLTEFSKGLRDSDGNLRTMQSALMKFSRTTNVVSGDFRKDMATMGVAGGGDEKTIEGLLNKALTDVNKRLVDTNLSNRTLEPKEIEKALMQGSKGVEELLHQITELDKAASAEQKAMQDPISRIEKMLKSIETNLRTFVNQFLEGAGGMIDFAFGEIENSDWYKSFQSGNIKKGFTGLNEGLDNFGEVANKWREQIDKSTKLDAFQKKMLNIATIIMEGFALAIKWVKNFAISLMGIISGLSGFFAAVGNFAKNLLKTFGIDITNLNTQVVGVAAAFLLLLTPLGSLISLLPKLIMSLGGLGAASQAAGMGGKLMTAGKGLLRGAGIAWMAGDAIQAIGNNELGGSGVMNTIGNTVYGAGLGDAQLYGQKGDVNEDRMSALKSIGRGTAIGGAIGGVPGAVIGFVGSAALATGKAIHSLVGASNDYYDALKRGVEAQNNAATEANKRAALYKSGFMDAEMAKNNLTKVTDMQDKKGLAMLEKELQKDLKDWDNGNKSRFQTPSKWGGYRDMDQEEFDAFINSKKSVLNRVQERLTAQERGINLGVGTRMIGKVNQNLLSGPDGQRLQHYIQGYMEAETQGQRDRFQKFASEIDSEIDLKALKNRVLREDRVKDDRIAQIKDPNTALGIAQKTRFNLIEEFENVQAPIIKQLQQKLSMTFSEEQTKTLQTLLKDISKTINKEEAENVLKAFMMSNPTLSKGVNDFFMKGPYKNLEQLQVSSRGDELKEAFRNQLTEALKKSGETNVEEKVLRLEQTILKMRRDLPDSQVHLKENNDLVVEAFSQVYNLNDKILEVVKKVGGANKDQIKTALTDIGLKETLIGTKPENQAKIIEQWLGKSLGLESVQSKQLAESTKLQDDIKNLALEIAGGNKSNEKMNEFNGKILKSFTLGRAMGKNPEDIVKEAAIEIGKIKTSDDLLSTAKEQAWIMGEMLSEDEKRGKLEEEMKKISQEILVSQNDPRKLKELADRMASANEVLLKQQAFRETERKIQDLVNGDKTDAEITKSIAGDLMKPLFGTVQDRSFQAISLFKNANDNAGGLDKQLQNPLVQGILQDNTTKGRRDMGRIMAASRLTEMQDIGKKLSMSEIAEPEKAMLQERYAALASEIATIRAAALAPLTEKARIQIMPLSDKMDPQSLLKPMGLPGSPSITAPGINTVQPVKKPGESIDQKIRQTRATERAETKTQTELSEIADNTSEATDLSKEQNDLLKSAVAALDMIKQLLMPQSKKASKTKNMLASNKNNYDEQDYDPALDINWPIQTPENPTWDINNITL